MSIATRKAQKVASSQPYQLWLLMRKLLDMEGDAPPFDERRDYTKDVANFMQSTAAEMQKLRQRKTQLEDHIFEVLCEDIPDELPMPSV